MSRAHQIRFVAHAWDYAVSLSIRTLADGPEREALIACEERPDNPKHPRGADHRPASSLVAAHRVRPGRDRCRGNRRYPEGGRS